MAITLDINKGDEIKTGKWKNHKEIVKDIDKDDYGMPLVNGKQITKIRISKQMKNEGKINRLLSLLEVELKKNLKFLKEDLTTPDDNSVFLDFFQELLTKDYSSFVQILSSIANDEKTQEFLKLGIKNKKWRHESFHMSVEEVPVKNLIPTQNEIDLHKSLNYPLSEADQTQEFFFGEGIQLAGEDIIVFNGKYIIDGHHRWSQVYCVNPEATVLCVNLQNPGLAPLDVLKTVQLAIAVVNGGIATESVNGVNMFQSSEQDIKALVLEVITPEVIAVFQRYKGLSDDDDIAEYIWGNCSRLISNNRPINNAPSRSEMPQTDSPKESLPSVLNTLRAGVPTPKTKITEMKKNKSKKSLFEAQVQGREEYRGIRYQILYDIPDGYWAGKDDETGEVITKAFFDTYDFAKEHAELEIDGYLDDNDEDSPWNRLNTDEVVRDWIGESKENKSLIKLLEKYTGKKVVLKEDDITQAPAQDGDNKEFINKMQKMFSADYTTFVKSLSSLIADDKTKQFLEAGLKDGKLDDDKFGIGQGTITVGKLIPTQNEIDISKSLNYPLTQAAQAETALGSAPITLGGNHLVTFNGKYIIDGHHRWSQIYCMNPAAKMTCVNLTKSNISPLIALKSTQVAIAASTGTVPVATVEGTNLLKANKEQVIGYVLKIITDEVVEVFARLKKLDTKEAIADYIWSNCEKMQKFNQPIDGAPSRSVMPQTDVDLPGVVKVLEKGVANSLSPFIKPAMAEAKKTKALIKLLEKYTNRKVVLKEDLRDPGHFWRMKNKQIASDHTYYKNGADESEPYESNTATNEDGETFTVGETAKAIDNNQKIKILGFVKSQNRIKAVFGSKMFDEIIDINGLTKLDTK